MFIPMDMRGAYYGNIELTRRFMDNAMQGVSFWTNWSTAFLPQSFAHPFNAAALMGERLSKDFSSEPDFGIKTVKIDGEDAKVHQKITMKLPFKNLHSFTCDRGGKKVPQIYIGAPMSGHYSTLLRPTVAALLPYADIHISSHKNARDIPLSEGDFGFADDVKYHEKFLAHIKKKTKQTAHMIAVCQPTVGALVALERNAEMASLTLMGGPIDTRVNQTEISRTGVEKDIQWFRDNTITQVPGMFKGVGREVYAGMLQLTGFMNLDPVRHSKAFWSLFEHLAKGEFEQAQKFIDFYNEYRSVSDLPAQFFLDTIAIVFQNHDVPNGTLELDGKIVNLGNITNTPLFVVEGARDNIAAPGQCLAALELCTGLPADQKYYYLDPKAGHYGIFSGRQWLNEIRPRILDYICKAEAKADGIVFDGIPDDIKKDVQLWNSRKNPIPAPEPLALAA